MHQKLKYNHHTPMKKREHFGVSFHAVDADQDLMLVKVVPSDIGIAGMTDNVMWNATLPKKRKRRHTPLRLGDGMNVTHQRK